MMPALAVWVDDYALRALPRLEADLTRLQVVLLRNYQRLPNPKTIQQLEYRQIAVVGGADFNHLLGRIEAATATLRVGVVAVLPPGCPDGALLRGPGVLDVLPAAHAQAAGRIAVMANVPIVAPRGARGVARPVGSQVGAATVPCREVPQRATRAVAIASSTGGCWLAAEIIRSLPRGSTGPILLAQHMDSDFVGFFADWIESSCGRRTVVARSSVQLEPDTIYLAEGGRDLVVAPEGLHAASAPASSHFVPSANRLFKTFAAAYGPRGTAVVLSGMGEDGAEGLEEVALRGGLAVCQSPESAIVPSMPASALKRARGAIAVPPAEIPRTICAQRP